ncbi:hypothetical protein AAW51_3522 [Caldimonas brevitalea]|uniref:Peptidase M50 domain-containing protein n=2 Tax=Caldimonas brevitalea TaxID=413882 RepID=A0A0G3BQF0_9BURK|nr:hypothetical protein AAW51_3522 [Caldimonas brevitalea]
MTVSLALWGLAFDWTFAAALVAVLLVHELGHALAMRVLGWKDMSMFFVPFVGAVVTGRTGEVPAWKQTLVLLAGPLPGLLAGSAALLYPPDGAAALPWWDEVAFLAVTVNLFNLLPITPLDGGRLVEIALFSRWPRLRLVFAAISVAGLGGLAWWLESMPLGAVALLLALALPHEWRAAKLEADADGSADGGRSLAQLCDQVQQRFSGLGLPRQLALVQSVQLRRRVRPPRRWESVATLLILAAAYTATLPLLKQAWPHHRAEDLEADARTPAQVAFDIAWDEYDMLSDDNAPADAKLRARQAALAADDLRHVDMQVLQAQALRHPERRLAIEALLEAGRDGERWELGDVLQAELDTLAHAAGQANAKERAVVLGDAIAWAERAAPTRFAPTVRTRLLWAEALDQAGDTPRAQALLAELTQRTLTADDCQCELREVVRARAWFALSHRQADQAIAVLEEPRFRDNLQQGEGRLAIDYAWALLLAGQTDRGLAVMRLAAVVKARPGRHDDAARRGAAPPEHVRNPLDLAFALSRAGRDDEARALLGQHHGRWHCTAAARGWLGYPIREPWQGERWRHLQETASRLCPTGHAAPS